MIEIKELGNEYKGKEILFEYQTDYFYDFEIRNDKDECSIVIVKKEFEETMSKEFSATLFEDYLEEPRLFGAKVEGEVEGYIELSHEKWNNRIRVSNILVEKAYRNKGIGKILIQQAIEIAKEVGARAIVLETQSCNFPAISFYKNCGFEIIGCDLSSYSNQDIEKREVRIEMALRMEDKVST